MQITKKNRKTIAQQMKKIKKRNYKKESNRNYEVEKYNNWRKTHLRGSTEDMSSKKKESAKSVIDQMKSSSLKNRKINESE